MHQITPEIQKKGSKSPRTTLRHRIALKEITDRRGKNIRRALLEAGYSTHTADKPTQVTESKGFQALLKETGLTQELIARSLKEDIEGKPRKRVEELKLAADILRMRGDKTAASEFKPTKIVIQQMNVMAHLPEKDTEPTPTHTEHKEIP